MILLTRLHGAQFYINAEMILSVEQTPDTMITLIDGAKLRVKEPAEVVAQRCIAYQRQVKNPNWCDAPLSERAAGNNF